MGCTLRGGIIFWVDFMDIIDLLDFEGVSMFLLRDFCCFAFVYWAFERFVMLLTSRDDRSEALLKLYMFHCV